MPDPRTYFGFKDPYWWSEILNFNKLILHRFWYVVCNIVNISWRATEWNKRIHIDDSKNWIRALLLYLEGQLVAVHIFLCYTILQNISEFSVRMWLIMNSTCPDRKEYINHSIVGYAIFLLQDLNGYLEKNSSMLRSRVYRYLLNHRWKQW